MKSAPASNTATGIQTFRLRRVNATAATMGAASTSIRPATPTQPWTGSGSLHSRKHPEKPKAAIINKTKAGTAETAYPTMRTNSVCHHRRGLEEPPGSWPEFGDSAGRGAGGGEGSLMDKACQIGKISDSSPKSFRMSETGVPIVEFKLAL